MPIPTGLLLAPTWGHCITWLPEAVSTWRTMGAGVFATHSGQVSGGQHLWDSYHVILQPNYLNQHFQSLMRGEALYYHHMRKLGHRALNIQMSHW